MTTLPGRHDQHAHDTDPKTFPHGNLPAHVLTDGHEAAYALRATFSAMGIRPKIEFYRDGCVMLYAPGSPLSLTSAEAHALARLVGSESP